jgi:hypothetical protein
MYAVVRTDNMEGTTQGKFLVSLRYTEGGEAKEIENGSVVLVGKLTDGEREVREAGPVAVDSPLSKVALVASPEVVKTKSHNALADFINLAGDILTGYKLVSGDFFSITKEGFADGSVLEVGSVVELAAGTKVKAVKTATSGATQVGEIYAIEGNYYVIEVA